MKEVLLCLNKFKLINFSIPTVYVKVAIWNWSMANLENGPRKFRIATLTNTMGIEKLISLNVFRHNKTSFIR